MALNDTLRTLFAGAAAVGLTGALSPVVAALAQGGEERPDPVLRFWARSLLRAAAVSVRCRGLEQLPVGQHFVLVVNHQSHFDPVVLLASIPRHLRYVAKAELFDIPVFGPAMRAVGNIPVARDGGQGDRSRMEEARRAVQERVSVVFFAEGTRSAEGRLMPFKKGAAVLALEAQVPLVPAAIAGTREILPKGSRQIRAGRPVGLVIGEPLSTQGRGVDERETLTARARARVETLLIEANALLG